MSGTRVLAGESGRVRGTGPAPGLLLASQLIFNVGFFSVVPFLAVSMRGDFGMGALAIGVVLGARTFSQQGMFLFGGVLADRWGARQLMVSGCLVRVAGYLVLAWAADFPSFLAGAIITGIGGALFSPALESLVGKAPSTKRGNAASSTKPTLFALLVIFGEIGAVAGPVLGAMLLGVGFDAALVAGAAIFALMALVFLRWIPGTDARSQTAISQGGKRDRAGAWSCLRERRFVLFAVFYAANLLAYNQLYLGLPVELERSGAGVGALAGVFVYVSLLTVALQWPIAGFMRRVGDKTALTLGFSLQAAGFLLLAVLATREAPEGVSLAPAALMVTALALGHMCVTPTAMGLVAGFAHGHPAGAYYGLLATCGGMAVLAGNALLGPLYEHAYLPSLAAAAPWAALALLAATSAVAIRRFVPGH